MPRKRLGCNRFHDAGLFVHHFEDAIRCRGGPLELCVGRGELASRINDPGQQNVERAQIVHSELARREPNAPNVGCAAKHEIATRQQGEV